MCLYLSDTCGANLMYTFTYSSVPYTQIPCVSTFHPSHSSIPIIPSTQAAHSYTHLPTTLVPIHI